MKRTPHLPRRLLTALLVVLSLRPSFSPAATLSASEGIDLGHAPSGLIYNGKAVSLANDLNETDWGGAFSAGLFVPAANLTGFAAGSTLIPVDDLLPFRTFSLDVVDPSNAVTIGLNGRSGLITAAQLKLTGGSPGAGKVLTSAADGSASWQAPVGTGTVTSSGTLSLADTAVTAGSYGSASAIPSFIVDAQGRLTAAASVALPDTSATNEIQTLGLTGSTLSLSLGGGSVDLASLNTDAQNLSVSGNTMSISGGTGATVPNLYTSNGTLSGQRTVSQGPNSLSFTGTGGLLVTTSNYVQFGSDKATREVNAGQIGYERFTAGALDIVGAGDYGSLRYVKVWDNLLIDKISTLEFGHRMPGKDPRAGQIGYNLAGNALDIVGAGTAPGQRGVKVWDNLTVVAACSAASFINTSDRRLKQDIKPTHYGLDAVLKMQVVDYRYQADPKKPHTGFIAQDLHQVYPEAVAVGGEEVKTQPWGVDYAKLTPLLTKAIQEQQQQIETLTQDKAVQAAAIAALKKQQAAEITTLKAALQELHQLVRLKTTPREPGRKSTASR